MLSTSKLGGTGAADTSALNQTRDMGNNTSVLLPQQPKLYVVPALKKELRDAYVRMRTLKFKKQMAR